MQKTIIVVPCYNEQRRLAVGRFRAFLEQNRNTALLMVNDGSQDGTLAILRGIEHDNPAQVAVLDLQQNMGKAEAIRRGVLEALRWQPDFVGFWDADLATPLDSIAAFREVLVRRPEIQLVIGCRLRLQGHRIARGSLRHTPGADVRAGGFPSPGAADLRYPVRGKTAAGNAGSPRRLPAPLSVALDLRRGNDGQNLRQRRPSATRGDRRHGL